jgi:hypothetical protein
MVNDEAGPTRRPGRDDRERSVLGVNEVSGAARDRKGGEEAIAQLAISRRTGHHRTRGRSLVLRDCW